MWRNFSILTSPSPLLLLSSPCLAHLYLFTIPPPLYHQFPLPNLCPLLSHIDSSSPTYHCVPCTHYPPPLFPLSLPPPYCLPLFPNPSFDQDIKGEAEGRGGGEGREGIRGSTEKSLPSSPSSTPPYPIPHRQLEDTPTLKIIIIIMFKNTNRPHLHINRLSDDVYFFSNGEVWEAADRGN